MRQLARRTSPTPTPLDPEPATLDLQRAQLGHKIGDGAGRSEWKRGDASIDNKKRAHAPPRTNATARAGGLYKAALRVAGDGL
eukprot:14772583-Alexandrium_andersonii.AAC.1